MSGDLEFDRSAVGIIANSNWNDAEEFGRISGSVLSMTLFPTARPLPEGDNSGVTALSTSTVLLTLRNVIAEFSDAAAVLGSGTEDAIADFDHTEYEVTESYNHLQQRLGGGGPVPMMAE